VVTSRWQRGKSGEGQPRHLEILGKREALYGNHKYGSFSANAAPIDVFH
jgi:hypothetical protein